MDDELRRAERAGDVGRLEALRARAGLASCGHGEPAGGPCAHLEGDAELGATWRFTGAGQRFDLLCRACAAEEAPPTRPLCARCVEEARRRHACEGFDTRRLVVPRRDVGLALAPPELRPAGGPVIALAPVERAADGACVALLADGRLVRVGPDGATPVATLAPGALELAAEVVVRPSPDGERVAVAERLGRRAVVVDAAGRTRRSITRGDYQVRHCPFPLAWAAHEGRRVLVHAADWNRLEAIDPDTGASVRPDAPAEEHDHFVGALALSADGRWIADAGWVWHPVGVTRSWRLDRWLAGASLAGSGLQSSGGIAYGLDLPHAFVGDALLAWGIGEDADALLPGCRRIDVEAGREVGWFFGPEGELAADGPRLVACSATAGLTVWDPADGARLLAAPEVRGVAWHPAARAVVSATPAGELRLDRVV